MAKALQTVITQEEWYTAFMEECRAIVVEGEFTARWALVECYHQLGKRILEENHNFERAQIYGVEISQRVGECVGKSWTTVKYAVQFAKQYPNLDDVPGGKAISWHRVCNELLPAPKQVVTPEFPVKKYHCIVIDPPWPVKKIEREERPKQGAELDYPTMTLEQIEALPIQDFANQDGCHLYLWVTQKYLPDGLQLVEHWGFKYQCLMTWVKPTGMTPYSWMYNTEHVIFARCGNLPLNRMGLKLSFEAPITHHSEKPDIFYERVIEASPNKRLDMFARKERDGFDVWGNEV